VLTINEGATGKGLGAWAPAMNSAGTLKSSPARLSRMMENRNKLYSLKSKQKEREIRTVRNEENVIMVNFIC
jgi:hypothetical protein